MDKWTSGIKELVSFLADIFTVWVAVESLSLFRRGGMLPLFKKLRQLMDTDEVQEAPPTPHAPVFVNLVGTVRAGFPVARGSLSFQHDGYTALRHRQNIAAYYYSPGASDTPLPLRVSLITLDNLK